MPTNLLKEYPELLEILHLPADKRKESLLKIFKRDIEDNEDFKFRGVQIYPIKTDGEIDMAREFMHLTTEEVEEADENGVKQAKKRVFDMHRSQRLHCINHHIHERIPENIEIFSIVERDTNKRQNIIKTYIYDKEEKYLIVLECQRKGGYFLLTAYYLNRPYAEKQLKKKMKNRLDEVI